VVFETKSLTTADESISDVSVKVRKGEILGIAGLLGSGKDILARVIAGSTPIKSGEVILNGESFVPKRPKQVINKGITVLPAERTLEGLILRQSLNFNMTLSSFKRFSKFGIMNARKDFRLAEKAASDVNLKYVTLRQQALSLSGGNQQRVMIARALLTNAKIIVFNEPTQGVDVGAKQEIHKLIRSYVSRGGSVIIISSELPELLSTSDNIAVMSRGRIVANYTGDEASEETLLKQMIG
jgi:ribose transport system ATP-binding protein